jgi:hypothetical protein
LGAKLGYSQADQPGGVGLGAGLSGPLDGQAD